MKEKIHISKKLLNDLYIDKKLSTYKIAKILKYNHVTIWNRLKKYNIQTRKSTENYQGQGNPNYKGVIHECIDCGKKANHYVKTQRCWDCFVEYNRGENHYNWKDGITSLNRLIRAIKEYKQWRNRVFERDDFTCQECGHRGGNLEAHHKKLFIKLLQEFLKEYDQFSPIEDKETLIRLAMKWQPFWDIDNGKTLCEDCHNKTKLGLKNGTII